MSTLAGPSGCIPAVPVPFNSDLSLNLQPIAGMAELLAGMGCKAVFVGGTFSEGFALAPHERQRLISAWCEAAAARRMSVIAHCSYESLVSTRETARAAIQAGCAALAPASSAEQVLDWMEVIGQGLTSEGSQGQAGGTGKARVPMLYYHRPTKFNASPSCLEILTLAHDEAERWPHVAFGGIKHCDEGGLVELAACLAYLRDYSITDMDILPAMEETLLPAAALGAKACILGAGFYAYSTVTEVWGAVKAGNMRQASEAYTRLMALAALVRSSEYGQTADMQKAIADAALTGLLSVADAQDPVNPRIAPFGPPRPPYTPMDIQDRLRLHKALGEAGFQALAVKAAQQGGGGKPGTAQGNRASDPSQPVQKAARLV